MIVKLVESAVSANMLLGSPERILSSLHGSWSTIVVPGFGYDSNGEGAQHPNPQSTPPMRRNWLNSGCWPGLEPHRRQPQLKRALKSKRGVRQNRFGIPSWGRFTTHVRTYFSWDVHWVYDLDFDAWPSEGCSREWTPGPLVVNRTPTELIHFRGRL